MLLLSISIISHGHSFKAKELVSALTERCTGLEVILTINAPHLESPEWLESLTQFKNLRVIVNDAPKGFAENHNHAAKIARYDFFCALNPDISLVDKTPSPHDWQSVLVCLQSIVSVSNVGVAYPVQIDMQGKELDYERGLITPWQLARRHLWAVNHQPTGRVDWVSGAFMMFRTEIFRKFGGFDERYHLYCEDVDICLRLKLAGYKLVKAPCTVVHDTGRQTLKNRQHLAWHLQSLVKLWFSNAYWQYLRFKMTQ